MIRWLIIIGFLALLVGQPVAAQPGCYGTPTPTPEPDGSSGFVQSPCDPFPSPTPTAPPLEPDFGDSGGVTPQWNYQHDVQTYNWGVPQPPAIASPTRYGGSGGETELQQTAQAARSDELSQVSDLLATAENNYTVLPAAFDNAAGYTDFPTDPQATINEFLPDLIFFFSVLKSLDPAQLGRVGELLRSTILLFFVIFLLIVPRWFLDAIAAIWRIIAKLIEVVKP